VLEAPDWLRGTKENPDDVNEVKVVDLCLASVYSHTQFQSYSEVRRTKESDFHPIDP